MKRICAWCSKDMNPDEKFASDGPITHGICSQCAISFSNYKRRTIQELLKLIQEPVFVIDSEGIVKFANDMGLKALGKEYKDVENKLGGDAFECVYAKEEEGCGKTVHCKTCGIRNTVMDTLKTGQAVKNVPAYQSINTGEGEKILKYSISTEKINDQILLRIDNVSEV